jgi:hypothetical protein
MSVDDTRVRTHVDAYVDAHTSFTFESSKAQQPKQTDNSFICSAPIHVSASHNLERKVAS